MWQIGMLLEIALMIYYVFFVVKEKNPHVVWKTITSIGFVILGMGACVYSGQNYDYFIGAGLLIGAIGDYLLAMQYYSIAHKQVYFLLGLGSFALGHIAYSMAFYNTTILSFWLSLLISISLAVITVGILGKLHLQFKEMTLAVLFYCTMIYFMELQALCLLPQATIGVYILNMGTALFVLSDLILAFIYYRDLDTLMMNRINLTFYYTAQLLIVLHLYL